MVKRFLLILALLFLPVQLYAATYYMATTGNNSNNGSESAPWLTLAYSFSKMSGGDTLIIEDGVYTGSANRIGVYAGATAPPNGTSAAYTTIKARNDGGVIFDGENTQWVFYVTHDTLVNHYWVFRGIVWCRTTEPTVYIARSAYVKFINCGAYDAPAGNYSNFTIHRNCDHILLEGCYAYGTGRYKIYSYLSTNIIFRNCVARYDSVDAGGEPCAVIAMYSVTNGEVQNCIAIDADQTSYWANVGDRQGCFFVPCTDAPSDKINFRNCIGLNVKLGGLQTAHNTDSSNIVFDNVAIWDCDDAGTNINMIRGSSNIITHCTFGSGTTSNRFMYWDGANGTFTNNIVTRYTLTDLLIRFESTPTLFDYNAYYGNSNNNYISGSHNQLVDPIYNAASNPTGALKYITRIESGSNLSGKGHNSSDIGANVLTLIGTPGTLWGETGYNTDTGVSMWPFPNEDLIRSKMKAYTHSSGVSGNRGFCADGETLTHYIWNYLGNVGEGETPWLSGTDLTITTTTLPHATQNTYYAQQISASGGTSPYTFSLVSGTLPTGLSLSSGGSITGTPTTSGTSNFTVRVTDADNTTDDQGLSITVDAAGTPQLNAPRPILKGRIRLSNAFYS